MFAIGQFAQIAKVSVRTLRHYDEVGLLRPASVDPGTGYRSYVAQQLAALNRILVLKDLGFTLAEITGMLEAGVGTDELLGMLRLRQAEAQRQAEDEQRRLQRVAARIAILSGVSDMNNTDMNDTTDLDTAVVVKPLDALRIAVLAEATDGFDDDFGPIFGRLYPALFAELERQRVTPAGPPCALYEQRDDGRIDVLAGVPVAPDADVAEGVVQMRDLGPVERAATLVHLGSMESIVKSYAVLDGWMAAAGEQPVGFSREIYLECPPNQADWVTELQFVLG